LRPYGTVNIFAKMGCTQRVLYLAVPVVTYDDFFKKKFIQISLEENQVKLMVFDPNLEEVLQWID
jgi:hypothetical protein